MEKEANKKECVNNDSNLENENFFSVQKKIQDYNFFYNIGNDKFVRYFVLCNPNWIQKFDYSHDAYYKQIVSYYEEEFCIFKMIEHCKSVTLKSLLLSHESFNRFNIVAVDFERRIFIGYPKHGQMYKIDFYQGENENSEKCFQFQSVNYPKDNVDDNLKKNIMRFLEKGENEERLSYHINWITNMKKKIPTLKEKIYNFWKKDKKDYVTVEEIDTEEALEEIDIRENSYSRNIDNWQEYCDPIEYYRDFYFDEEQNRYFRPRIHFLFDISHLFSSGFDDNNNNNQKLMKNSIYELLSKIESFRELVLNDEMELILHNVIEINFSQNSLTCIDTEKDNVIIMTIYNFVTKERTFNTRIKFDYFKTKYFSMKNCSWL